MAHVHGHADSHAHGPSGSHSRSNPGSHAHGHDDQAHGPHDHARGTNGHAHGHGHHGHDHHHKTRAFGVGVLLNLGLVCIEVAYGVAAHSVALLADAGHNLSDVLGLVLATAAAILAQRKPTKQHTYGYRRLTVLAALANAILLLVATGGVMWESIRRLHAPSTIDARTVILVALAGAAVNITSALFFFSHRNEDMNVRAAFVHLLGDAAISLGVVGASLVVLKTGWLWVDPATAIVVSVLILVSTWSLLRQSLNLALDAVPDGVDIDALREFLERLPQVHEVHDLHVWAMSTTETALTAHLVMPAHSLQPTFLTATCKELHDRFGIEHATLQVDPAEAPAPCRLAAEETL